MKNNTLEEWLVEAALGRSWSICGTILGAKIMILSWFYNGFVNMACLHKNIASKTISDRLVPNWVLRCS